MGELIFYAIPAFVLLLAAEWTSFAIAGHDHRNDLRGYDLRDTRTSLTMGIGNVVIDIGWKLAIVATYAGLYELTPLRMPTDAWWAWLVLFFADDLAFYTYHRVSHEVRLFWASHVVHHSSEHYNLSTALRQPWIPMTALPFWMPLALLGFKPWMILTQQAISLIYQFFLHTERVGRLPRPVEFLFNTPSHHRVHHASDEEYLDRNYGGILIVWDRIFGSFKAETTRPRYGLTTNIETFNPMTVAFHEVRDIVADVRAAPTLRDKAGFVLRGPGWATERRRQLAGAAVPAAPAALEKEGARA